MKLKYIFILSVILFSCKEDKVVKNDITLDCIRNFDTLSFRISNNSKDTLYIPASYVGTFKVDGDTVSLEVTEKTPDTFVEYYGYYNLFHSKVFTARRIDKQTPDTVIKIFYQASYINQFRLNPFITIAPKEVYTKSLVFNVPQRANIVRLAYYKMSFDTWYKKKSSNYQMSDFLKFDSTQSEYVYSNILNCFHLK